MMFFYYEYGLKPNVLVLRKHFRTHKNSTRSQLIWAIKRLGVENDWHIPLGEHTLTFKPSRQVILFRGMQDTQGITSITVEHGHLCWFYLEEAFQIDSEDDFNKLDLSLRGHVPTPLFKQFIIAFNPWDSKHWLNRRFFDSGKDQETNDILSRTSTYKCNEFLDDADKKVFEDMKKKHPARYNTEGRGNWGISEGCIYNPFIENERDFYDIEVCPNGDIIVGGKRKRIAHVNLGVDIGGNKSNHAFCCTGITEDFEDLVLIKSRVLKAKGTTPNHVAQGLEDFYDSLPEWEIDDIYIDSAEQLIKNCCEEKLQNHGVRNSIKKPINDRIDLTNTLMGQRRFWAIEKDTKPTCEFFKSARWDEKSLKRKRLDDGSYDVDSGDAYEYSHERYMKMLIHAGGGKTE